MYALSTDPPYHSIREELRQPHLPPAQGDENIFVGVGHGFSLIYVFFLFCSFSPLLFMPWIYARIIYFISGLYFILNWLNRKYKLMFCLMRLIANITFSRLCSLKGGRISNGRLCESSSRLALSTPSSGPLRAGTWWSNGMRVAIDICPSNNFIWISI